MVPVYTGIGRGASAPMRHHTNTVVGNRADPVQETIHPVPERRGSRRRIGNAVQVRDAPSAVRGIGGRMPLAASREGAFRREPESEDRPDGDRAGGVDGRSRTAITGER